MLHFAVVGAGVVGLSTALELQRRLPQAGVTIIADRFTVDTTSDVAAGLFRPSSSFSGPNAEITRQWIVDSYEYWRSILHSSQAEEAGLRSVDVLIVSNTDICNAQNSILEEILPNYRPIDFAQLTADKRQQPAGTWTYGSEFTTLLADCRRYLPWATNKLIAAGGTVQRRHVSALHDLSVDTHSGDSPLPYTAVFNCSGLGARKLCDDKQLVPIRGQVVRVHAPWLTTAMYADFDTYIIPVGSSGEVVLGGVRHYDSYSAQLCRHDRAAILERCDQLCPGIAAAPVLREQTGLRPHRSAVRVECEWLRRSNGNAKGSEQLVVHHYGHGGYGVSTGPGTARYAVQLAIDALQLT